MNNTISHEALVAYLNFFGEDESWPENDPYSAYQPNYDHIIARLIVETYFNPKLGEVTDKGVNFLAEVLPEIDGIYGISLSTIPGKPIKGNSVQAVKSTEIEQIIEVAKAIDFLINMQAYDMAHYPDDDERSEDHSHEWALANLINDECEDSLSYIGDETYCFCELATAVTIEAINPRPEDILGIISIAPRVLEVLEINQQG